MSSVKLAIREAAVWLVAMAVPSAAQTAFRPPTDKAPPGSYRIAGVLVNAATGQPIPRATVEALRADDSLAVASCATDSEGRFALERLAAAKYQLTASKRGFRTAFYDEHEQFSTAIVTGPEQDTTQLEFKLMPGALLRGIVTGSDGEAVENARVMLFKRPQFPSAGERTMQVGATTTDDTGAYELADLAAGEYLLAVAAEPWYAVHEGTPARRNAALDVAYPVTYFDSTTEEGSATPIVLGVGSRQEANISLQAVPALHLSFSTPRRPNESAPMPQLQATIFGNTTPLEIPSETIDPRAGTAEIGGIAPGHYEITHGDPTRIEDLDLTASQQVDPNAGSAANAVEGRVRMASGAPLPEQITVSLQRIDNGIGRRMDAAQAIQGRFRFDAVPPGDWSVMATTGDKAMAVVGVNASGVQRAGNLVSVGARTSELVVTLSEAPTHVEGFARKDEKGFAGAMIVLLPKNRVLWKALTRRDQSDSDGSFALPDVAPGEYFLIAIEDGWALDWTSPEAMARYLPGGVSVTVTAQSGTLIRLNSPLQVQTR